VKTKRYSGEDLRRVLAGMITDQVVCSRIASQWRPEGLFDSPWANLVGGWAVDHLLKYDQPPNDQIKSLFEAWVNKTDPSREVVEPVERFLQALSDEYSQQEKPTSDYLLDCAGRLFNKTRMKQAMEEATDNIDRDQVDEAYGKLTGLNRVELGVGAVIKPAEDFDAWRQAFNTEQQRQLVSYPDDLDWFIGKEIVRDSLIAFMGPDKSGKSFWLLDLAYRAIRGRCRVAFFEVGDMGRDAVMRRLGQRAARRPLGPSDCFIPISVAESGRPMRKKKTFDGELTPAESFKAFQKVTRGRDVFRLACYPNSSINVEGIVSVLRDWEREDFIADVVVIDYADILAPPSGIRDTLDQIDVTWKSLRRMSQELHCLVVTATQSNATAYKGKQRVLGRQHFSGRKTKLAEVNGMIGINVSPRDKKFGTTWLNWVVKREGYYNEQWMVPAAGCLAIANPAIRSQTKREKS